MEKLRGTIKASLDIFRKGSLSYIIVVNLILLFKNLAEINLSTTVYVFLAFFGNA